MKAPDECAICDAEAKHIDVRVSTDGGPEARFLCCDDVDCCSLARDGWRKEQIPTSKPAPLPDLPALEEIAGRWPCDHEPRRYFTAFGTEIRCGVCDAVLPSSEPAPPEAVECSSCEATADHIDVRPGTGTHCETRTYRFPCCGGACCTAGAGAWVKESLTSSEPAALSDLPPPSEPLWLRVPEGERVVCHMPPAPSKRDIVRNTADTGFVLPTSEITPPLEEIAGRWPCDHEPRRCFTAFGTEVRCGVCDTVFPQPPDTDNLDVPALIAAECDAVRDLLLSKNAKYGNSALEPARIFSKASPVEQILVRIDDKLSRIRTTGVGAQTDEDTVQDLIGYLILLRVAQRKAK
jgi:hypothetical protein